MKPISPRVLAVGVVGAMPGGCVEDGEIVTPDDLDDNGGDEQPAEPDQSVPDQELVVPLAQEAAVMPSFCNAYPPANLASFGQSSRVFYGADGFLQYASDASKNRVP